FAVIADEAARRAEEGEARLAAARGPHIGHRAFAKRKLLDDNPGKFVIDVNNDFFERLQPFPVLAGPIENAGAADRKLEAFAAHGFDENAKLQLAAAGDDIGIGFGAILNADRDVAFRFLQKARANDAALHLVAVAPRER